MNPQEPLHFYAIGILIDKDDYSFFFGINFYEANELNPFRISKYYV